MGRWDTYWERLSLQSGSALETVASLVETVERDHPEDSARLEPIRVLAMRLEQSLESAHSGQSAEWKDWVAAETTWIELRFEMHRLLASEGTLRTVFVDSVRRQLRRLEDETGKLLARSDRFRPRTRVAISQEVQRLRRRLDVLREETTRIEQSGPAYGPRAIQSVGRTLPNAAWEVAETKRRFARSRWRQGRELAPV
jgi:hypothetical protein